MRKVQEGDRVKVIAGNDKGKEGEVLSVDPKSGRVVVENVNFRLRHQQRTQQQKEPGIIEREEPIDISNVMPICPSCDEPTRVGFDEVAGEKVRVCKKCEGVLE
ncbi:50S ribosomal protein L24 [Candidatus Bipolaricaulota bacterium]|nr:50S ribosomal protein L24 [Candidatus Bipolaricaulota bacterium]MBS3813816.1 50S ribosomal protein L24 [Candidatus Bipolaricaulota bacterium]MBS3824935.1 50S ribosomal protein L24 [Candidatus Bipolaricaulota bacterium]